MNDVEERRAAEGGRERRSCGRPGQVGPRAPAPPPPAPRASGHQQHPLAGWPTPREVNKQGGGREGSQLREGEKKEGQEEGVEKEDGKV